VSSWTKSTLDASNVATSSRCPTDCVALVVLAVVDVVGPVVEGPDETMSLTKEPAGITLPGGDRS